MNIKIISTCIISVATILTGCKEYCKVDCTAEAPILFAGYSNSELDSIVFNAYIANDSFNNLIYTKVFHIDSLTGLTTGDTIYLSSAFDANEDMGIHADYEIIIPADNKTYRITNIQYTGD